MKKIFKALAILAATTAIGAGVGLAAGCSGGKNGNYEGEYHYVNEYGVTYGMKVRVTVKNNIITKVEDITKDAYEIVSPGWEDYFKANAWLHPEGWTEEDPIPAPADVNMNYKWTNDDADVWTTNESWLLQQYEGWTVSDILDIQVFIKETGEPYSKDHNSNLLGSELIITNSTQGSGRLLLAVQNALGKTTEIGRIEKAE